MKVMVPVSPEKALVSSSLSDTNPPAWSPSTAYKKSDPVTHANGVYAALVAHSAKYPDREPACWQYLHTATPALWSATTTYAAGETARYGQQRYRSLQDQNCGYRPDSEGEWWVCLGPINSWAAFDRTINTKAVAMDAIRFELNFSGCNSLSLFGLEAQSVHFLLRDSAGKVVKEESVSLTGVDASSWWNYFIEPLTPREDIVQTQFPVLAYSRLTLTVQHPGSVARVGSVAVGRCKTLGATQYGAEMGITDYSRKSTDSFGNTYLSVGSWAKTTRLDLHVMNTEFDDVFRTLAKLRATPTVFIGDNTDTGFDSLTVWGFVRDFRMVIDGVTHSQCSLDIQGLI